jgi:hypothetical protein
MGTIGIKEGLVEKEKELIGYLEQLKQLIFLIKYNTSARSSETDISVIKLEESEMWLAKELDRVQGLIANWND